jgi:DNA-directed RNA polymerase subunit RPC12/RpoP
VATIRPSEPAHIEPIRCEKCGGRATLMRRTPDAFKRDGRSELRTFECEACEH